MKKYLKMFFFWFRNLNKNLKKIVKKNYKIGFDD